MPTRMNLKASESNSELISNHKLSNLGSKQS